MKKRIITILLILKVLNVFSQVTPHWLTDKEKQQYPNYLHTLGNSRGSLPPAGKVRCPAEWEEMDGVILGWDWYSEAGIEIIKHLSDACNVYIVTSNPEYLTNMLKDRNISMDHVFMIEEPINSIWIRDYAPLQVYSDKVDSLLFVDWIYNRPRPDDDKLSEALASYFDVPLYQTINSPYRLVHTGGNFMSDGFGTAFSSKLVLDENQDLTETQIDTIMKRYAGIERYIKMDNLRYDRIHHIDMHAKLLDEETLLVGEYPEGVADGQQIEQNLQYILNNYPSVFGTPYRVIRIPMPPQEDYYPDQGSDYLTYTNSFIMNKTILVPTYNCQYDSTALAIYENAMPGYRVIGINSNELIPYNGAIHCITHEIAKRNPLLISLQRFHQKRIHPKDTLRLWADISHNTGVQRAAIRFRTDSVSVFDSVAMHFDSTAMQWYGDFPFFKDDTTIYYYVEAFANSGKHQVRPITAPKGFYSYSVNYQDQLIASAGQDTIIWVGDTLTLRATCSGMRQSDTILYTWNAIHDNSVIDNVSHSLQITIEQLPDNPILMYTLTASNGRDFSEPDTVLVRVKDRTTGLHAQIIENTMLYPTITSDFFRVKFQNKHLQTDAITINIYDICGTKKMSVITYPNRQISVSSLLEGIYLVEIWLDKTRTIRKLLVNNY